MRAPVVIAVGNWAGAARRNGVTDAEIARFDRTLTRTTEIVGAAAA
jgi:hypothetical protein